MRKSPETISGSICGTVFGAVRSLGCREPDASVSMSSLRSRMKWDSALAWHEKRNHAQVNTPAVHDFQRSFTGTRLAAKRPLDKLPRPTEYCGRKKLGGKKIASCHDPKF